MGVNPVFWAEPSQAGECRPTSNVEVPYITLPDELAATLRDMIGVPRLVIDSQLANPAIWPRCHRVGVNDWHKLIYVDGFAAMCHANSWKVFSDAIEDGLNLWLGFACLHSRWHEHAWCMLGDRIVETTYARMLYYGAELNANERAEFAKRHAQKLESAAQRHCPVMTFVDGNRVEAKYDPVEYGQSIGRERDRVTGKIKEGIGR